MTVNSDQIIHPSVICLGEALIDRLGPLGGDPLVDKPVEDCLGGAPANVASGLAKLGIMSAFVGRIGNDYIGEYFQNLFSDLGINTSGLQIDKIRPSRVVLVRRDHSGERSFQCFAGDKGEGFADQALALFDVQKAWPSLIKKARWLLIGSIPLATRSSEEVLKWSLNQAIENEIDIALDINWRPTFWDVDHPLDSGPSEMALKKIGFILERVSLLKLSREEAFWFFNSDDPMYISKSLPKYPDVIITNGAKPLRWVINDFDGEIDALSPQNVVDTTGAGDAFTAGLLHQLLIFEANVLDAKKTQEVVRFAAACGALVCGGAGGIDPQPTYEEVQSFLIASEEGGIK